MPEYIDYEYRVWDLLNDKWYERKQYTTALECQLLINYLVANGYAEDDFEIRTAEVRWSTYSDVPVPDVEAVVR